jgi:outer membrane immunogenic protein
MKRVLLCTTAAVLVVGPAIAADLPVKAPLYRVPPPIPYTWTGLYLGAHGGWGWSRANWTSDWNCKTFVLCDSVSNDISGGVAGGQVGYRWTSGKFVFGLEGSLAWANVKGTQARQLCTTGVGGCPALAGSPNLTYFTRVNNTGTVTAQVGYAWRRSLFYAKGGWAAAAITRSLTDNASAAAGEFTGDLNERATGWTAGAGWEYMWTQNLSAGLVYDYLHLSAGSVISNTIATGGAAVFTTLQSPVSLNINKVLARVNYRFDWLGPTVSRY